MKNAQIIVSNGKVCVLSVWSQRTKRWANELGNLNYQALANLRPGKGTYDSLIPDKKSKDGLKKLTASYGLQIDVDNQGEIYFISYAQQMEPWIVRATASIMPDSLLRIEQGVKLLLFKMNSGRFMRTWKIFSSPQLTQMGLQTIIVRETLWPEPKRHRL